MESNSPNSIRVLLIHQDAGTLQQVQDDLAHEALSDVSIWSCSNPVAGRDLAQDVGPHVILLDLDSDREMALEAIPTFVAGGAKVIGISNPILHRHGQVDLVRAAIRQGAYDFLDLPLQQPEVLAAFQRVRGEQPKDEESPAEGRAFGVMGLKGGVGSTTLALNLAAALADGGNRKVAFVDGCLQFGDAAAIQGLEITRTVVDVDKDWDSSTTRLEQWLDRDPRTQVYFLHRPNTLREASEIDPQQFTRILVRLLRMVDYLIVDLPTNLDLLTFSALEVCERTVVVADPKPSTVERASSLRTALQDLGLRHERLYWTVNRPTRLDLDYAMKEGDVLADLSPVMDLPNEPKLPELYGTGATSVLDRSRTGYARDVLTLASNLREKRS